MRYLVVSLVVSLVSVHPLIECMGSMQKPSYILVWNLLGCCFFALDMAGLHELQGLAGKSQCRC